MKIDSIIFDLDGTLWDSIEGICHAWNTVLSKYPNVRTELTPKDMEGCLGLLVSDIGKKLFPDLEEDFRTKLINECCETENAYLEQHGGNLYPRLEETLKKLFQNYKLFIVSKLPGWVYSMFFKST